MAFVELGNVKLIRATCEGGAEQLGGMPITRGPSLRWSAVLRVLLALRRGRFKAISGDDPALARSVWIEQFSKLGESWTEHYWNDLEAPTRKVMLQMLERVPFTTLLELGCNAGPNLR